MRKLLFILLFVPFKIFAANVILGTGSGTITQSGNPAGFNPATDTIFIAVSNPSYSSISITNLVGFPGGIVKIMPQDWATHGRVYMTGKFTINGKYWDCGYGSSTGLSTNVFDITGTSSHFKLHNWFAQSCGDFIDANTNKNGTYLDTSTYKWYIAAVDSIYMDSCNLFALTSFGATGDNPPKDVVDSCVFSNVFITRTKTNGTMVTGLIFRPDFHNWYTKTSYRLLNGDVGQFAMNGIGNGKIYNIFKNGGVGYVGRIIVFTMAADTSAGGSSPSVLRIWNVGQCNTSDYGVFDIKNDSTEWSLHIKGGSLVAYYTSAYNLGNSIAYWSFDYVMGDWYPPYTVTIKYSYGCKLTLNGKPKGAIYFQGVTAGVTIDTVGNFYADYANYFQIDTTGAYPTLKPTATSYLVGKGANISYVTTDYYGVNKALTAGFAEPATICNCIPHNGTRGTNAIIWKKSSAFLMKPKTYFVKDKQLYYA